MLQSLKLKAKKKIANNTTTRRLKDKNIRKWKEKKDESLMLGQILRRALMLINLEMLDDFQLLDTAFEKGWLRNGNVMLSLRHWRCSSNMEKKNTGMEAKVVCLPNPDLLEAPGFDGFLGPECCV